MKTYFYPKSTYTAINAFADIFDNMSVRVYDETTDEIVGIKPVTLIIAPKEKIASILLASNDSNDVDPQVDNYLPKISVNNTGVRFINERMRGKFERRLLNIEYDDNGRRKSLQTDTQPVPYDLTFEVTIWTKYLTDGLQIIENIVPFFAPQMFVSYKERNFGLEHKAKVTLDAITTNHVYEYGENTRRILQWNLSFTMETVMWKPMELSKEINCAVITIDNVPCKKVPFQGEKIVIYEPINNTNSLDDTKPESKILQLDEDEKYNLMVNYWKTANNNMKGNESCVTNNCSDLPPVSTPYWNDTQSACYNRMKKPCLVIDPVTGQISNFWQEQIVDSTGLINIISFKRVYDSQGNDIVGPEIISEIDFPECWNDTTLLPPITSDSSSSSSSESSISSISSSSDIICGYNTLG